MRAQTFRSRPAGFRSLRLQPQVPGNACQHHSVTTRAASAVFLGASDACRLARITREQLERWEQTDVFHRERADGELYSFRDVVGLRTLAELRARGVSLQHLRKVGEWIFEHYAIGTPWASLRFYVAGQRRKRVYFGEPKLGTPVAGPPGQLAIRETFSIDEIANRVATDLGRLTRRNRSAVGKLSRMRGVVGGAIVIKGTRIPVAAIRNFHDAGYSVEEILNEYPHLTVRDVEAAIDDQAGEQRAAS